MKTLLSFLAALFSVCGAGAEVIRINCGYTTGENSATFLYVIDTDRQTVTRNDLSLDDVSITSSTFRFSMTNDSGKWQHVVNRADGKMTVLQLGKENPKQVHLYFQCSKVAVNAF